MNATDQMAINDAGLRNPIVNRNNPVDESVALSHNEYFLTNLCYPQMFIQADRGNCPFLVRCKHPLLNGLQTNVSFFFYTK
jgi:hypothetical protein